MSILHRKIRVPTLIVSLLLGLTLLKNATAAMGPSPQELAYLPGSNPAHRLDLYKPDPTSLAPLIIWIHGGAWRSGSKQAVPILGLLDRGWAIASVEYRLSGEAPFPAMVHDIKAAIRFLRAESEGLALDSERFVIAGASAGGHLAALVGLSKDDPYLEGDLGQHLEASSNVGAIVSFYGAGNLSSILSQSTPHGLSVRVPALRLLFGGPIEEKEDLAQAASPVRYLSEDSAPILLIHGDADPQMPPAQSRELVEKANATNAEAKLVLIEGGKHGGPEFYDDDRLALVDGFLRQHLDP